MLKQKKKYGKRKNMAISQPSKLPFCQLLFKVMDGRRLLVERKLFPSESYNWLFLLKGDSQSFYFLLDHHITFKINVWPESFLPIYLTFILLKLCFVLHLLMLSAWIFLYNKPANERENLQYFTIIFKRPIDDLQSLSSFNNKLSHSVPPLSLRRR